MIYYYFELQQEFSFMYKICFK